MDVLYGENTFVYHVNGRWGAHLMSSFSARNLYRIWNLRLLHSFHAFSENYLFDPAIWSLIFGGLRKLELVPMQPWCVVHLCDDWEPEFQPSREECLKRYLVWLEPVLQGFKSATSSDLRLYLDDDGRVETHTLIELYFLDQQTPSLMKEIDGSSVARMPQDNHMLAGRPTHTTERVFSWSDFLLTNTRNQELVMLDQSGRDIEIRA